MCKVCKNVLSSGSAESETEWPNTIPVGQVEVPWVVSKPKNNESTARTDMLIYGPLVKNWQCILLVIVLIAETQALFITRFSLSRD